MQICSLACPCAHPQIWTLCLYVTCQIQFPGGPGQENHLGGLKPALRVEGQSYPFEAYSPGQDHRWDLYL